MYRYMPWYCTRYAYMYVYVYLCIYPCVDVYIYVLLRNVFSTTAFASQERGKIRIRYSPGLRDGGIWTPRSQYRCKCTYAQSNRYKYTCGCLRLRRGTWNYSRERMHKWMRVYFMFYTYIYTCMHRRTGTPGCLETCLLDFRKGLGFGASGSTK